MSSMVQENNLSPPSNQNMIPDSATMSVAWAADMSSTGQTSHRMMVPGNTFAKKTNISDPPAPMQGTEPSGEPQLTTTSRMAGATTSDSVLERESFLLPQQSSLFLDCFLDDIDQIKELPYSKTTSRNRRRSVRQKEFQYQC